MAGELVSFTQLAAAAAMLALAGWLLYLNFESRIHRALALVLFLRAAVTIHNRLIVIDAPRAEMWSALREYYFLGLLPALAYFAIVLGIAHGRPARRRGPATLLLVVLAVEALYLADHCLARCPAPDGRTIVGPLGLLVDGLPIGMALLAAGLAFAALRQQGGRQAALGLAAGAFLLHALFEAGLAAGVVAQLGVEASSAGFAPSLWADLVFPLRILTGVPAIAAAALLARVARAQSRGVWLVAAPALLALASGLYLGLGPLSAPRPGGIALAGLWLLALPALLVYAIVKHRLFDVDVRVHAGLRRTTVAALLLATFLVVSEIAQNWLDERYGVTVGGVATGLLLFALAPLQRIGDRLAHAALPHARPMRELGHPERLTLYREQAILAWSDGRMTAKERVLLDRLRDRLGLSREESARIETEVAHHAAALPHAPG